MADDTARLAALHGEFIRHRAAALPSEADRADAGLFEAWLDQQGLAPGDFSEEAWRALLAGLGLSPLEAAEWLGGIGEWGPSRAT